VANKYLVVCRAGDSSLHREWIKNAEHKNFDLWIDYYGNEENRYKEEADYYYHRKGLKWPILYKAVRDHFEMIFQYDAVWFPDDDLLADTKTIHDMFELFSEYRLQIAQPALTEDSYASYAITIRNPNMILRYVDFVEVMAPIFSREALAECYPTFNLGRTGWGLDFVWAKLLGYPTHGMAVLDATPVKHTRPVGGGDIYKNGMQQAQEEATKLLKLFQIDIRGNSAVYGGVAAEGKSASPSSELFASLLLSGSSRVIPMNDRHILQYYFPSLLNILNPEQGYHYIQANKKDSLPDYLSLSKAVAAFSELNPDNVAELVLEELSSLEDDTIFQAIELYDQEKIELLNSIAVGFFYNGIHDRVLPFLLTAYQLDNYFFNTLFNLGYVLHQYGEHKLSLQYLEMIKDKDTNVLSLIENVNTIVKKG